MELVLLSGGSGQRLWPLSNNARSKQFLSLLEREDGTTESMVQRVVRQAAEAGLPTGITLATNAAQTDLIRNQLGEGVTVVTEPERRDTFPAIALAVSHLALSRRCAADEVVVVMPCDPYTEAGYFRTIARMAECVEKGVADLVLMGVTPTYPSAKYGYVVPAPGGGAEDCRRVARFTEKPDADKARELIGQGALWNGGVFAFRLGYLMQMVRKYASGRTFGEIRARYKDFPKTSFDYEVAEKAESVAVVPFKGEWKDLGTWNTLTDELRRHTIGNATLGEKCRNVHVINELQQPIFVDGVQGVVVAASPDGILVCAKKETEFIKKHVDALATRPMYEEFRWGNCRVLDETTYPDGTRSLTRMVSMLGGRDAEYLSGTACCKAWHVVTGEGRLLLDGAEHPLRAGDTWRIKAGQTPSVRAVTDLSFVEVETESLPAGE